MPAQSFDSPAHDTPVGETHGDVGTTRSPEELDILDEDGLLEEQPYAALEENPESYIPVDVDPDEGIGSW